MNLPTISEISQNREYPGDQYETLSLKILQYRTVLSRTLRFSKNIEHEVR